MICDSEHGVAAMSNFMNSGHLALIEESGGVSGSQVRARDFPESTAIPALAGKQSRCPHV